MCSQLGYFARPVALVAELVNGYGPRHYNFDVAAVCPCPMT